MNAAATMSDPGFFEQYDESGARTPPGRGGPSGSSRIVGISILVALLVVGLIAAAWFFVLRTEETTPEELLNDALTAHVEGRLADASELYQKILLDDPTNKFAHYNIGLIAQTQNRPEDAERSYRQALATDAEYSPALFNLAIIRFDANDFTESIDLYRQVISITPDGASAHLNLGYALRAAGQFTEGDREIARAIELDPTLGPPAPSTTDTTDQSTDESTDESTEDSTTTTAD